MAIADLQVSGSQHSVMPIDSFPVSGPPPFLTKLYNMVDDSATDAMVSWSDGNNSFVVWKPLEWARDILPKYFKHQSNPSFVRQLSTYGFHKVCPERWEYANPMFLRGQMHLLADIVRRRPQPHHQTPQQQQMQSSQQRQQTQSGLGPCVEVETLWLENQAKRLRQDIELLKFKLCSLRQQCDKNERELRQMREKLYQTEQHLMLQLKSHRRDQIDEESENDAMGVVENENENFLLEAWQEAQAEPMNEENDSMGVVENENGNFLLEAWQEAQAEPMNEFYSEISQEIASVLDLNDNLMEQSILFTESEEVLEDDLMEQCMILFPE